MMRDILLVSDLDGTLLDSRQTISKQNKNAIKDFKKLGGKFTIATGRMEKSAQPYIDLLEIDIPVILYNGAVVYNHKTNKRLVDKSLKNYTPLIKLFREIAFKKKLGILIYQKGEVFTFEKNSLIMEYEIKDNVNCKLMSDENFEHPITKVLLISPERSTLQECETIIQECNYSCDLVYSESNYLEILPYTASKGNALVVLQDFLGGIKNLHTICVGDNLNDISMLEVASQGFVVENCHESMRNGKYARTLHHEKNALAHLIQKHIFSKEMKALSSKIE